MGSMDGYVFTTLLLNAYSEIIHTAENKMTYPMIIFGVVSEELTKILPIEKCIILDTL